MTNPYAKAAMLAIRLAACGLMLLSFMLYGPDLYLYVKQRPFSAPSVLALKAIPALAGVALYWKSRALAAYLTRDLD
jgi:hypothetical protein